MDQLTFSEELNQFPLDVPRAALRLAREINYPGLDIPQYITRLDWLAGMASKVMQPVWPVSVQAEALAEFLFKKLGFQGNQFDYIDPRNSYLNEVLDRRLGIPISLAVVYIAVAERLGLPAQGVGLPGHFIVSVQDPQGELYLDPFHGGRRLSKEDCAQLVILTTGYSGPFQEEWLAPSSPHSILARMLTNLKNVYMKKEAWPQVLAVLERLRLIQPDLPDHLRDLGLAYHQKGSLRLAVQYYEQYLTQAPEAPDAEEVKQNLRAVAQKLAQLN